MEHKKCAELPKFVLNIGNSEIKAHEEVQNLGVIFDANLTLKSLVGLLCNSGRYYLFIIFDLVGTTEKAICDFVTSRLDSNNSLLYDFPYCKLQNLQKI